MPLDYARLTPSDDVLAQSTGGEMVLLDLQSERYFGLDEVGARAWQLISENSDTAAAMQQLLAEYEVSEEQLSADLNALFAQLVAEKLLKPGKA